MKYSAIKSCYIGPEISPEQFVPEHFFLFLVKGKITGFDGYRKYTMEEGEYCLVRKNALARYSKQQVDGAFEKVVVILDEAFLKRFREKHGYETALAASRTAFITLQQKEEIVQFIDVLVSSCDARGSMDEHSTDIKRDELVLLLLQTYPELAAIFFDFGIPQKINLEEYMNRNYKFNVSMERFAYLTGRSLSAFKRDFQRIFRDTPGRWLVRRRLEEAHFLIEKKGEKPGDIYLDLGFEDFSHFSFAFKKQFGFRATDLLNR